jgi:hypothetical protein
MPRNKFSSKIKQEDQDKYNITSYKGRQRRCVDHLKPLMLQEVLFLEDRL